MQFKNICELIVQCYILWMRALIKFSKLLHCFHNCRNFNSNSLFFLIIVFFFCQRKKDILPRALHIFANFAIFDSTTFAHHTQCGVLNKIFNSSSISLGENWRSRTFAQEKFDAHKCLYTKKKSIELFVARWTSCCYCCFANVLACVSYFVLTHEGGRMYVYKQIYLNASSHWETVECIYVRNIHKADVFFGVIVDEEGHQFCTSNVRHLMLLACHI